jgi:hypothetical protein
VGSFPRLVAHGGTLGLLAELGVALLAGTAFALIWWRERKRRLGRAQRSTTKPP